MWNKMIPVNHFWKTDYPHLQDGADGACIPIAWGTILNVAPVCLDASTAQGDELVAYGNFKPATLVDWGSPAGWTKQLGKAHHANGGGVDPLTQNITVVSGAVYDVWFRLSSRTGGSVGVKIGSVALINTGISEVFGSNAYYKRTLTVGGVSGSQALTITPTDNFHGSIDDVSVKLSAYAGTNVFQFHDGPVLSLDKITIDNEVTEEGSPARVVLTEDQDYTADIANGKFTLTSTPLLESGHDYYMVFEADYDIDGSNYYAFCGPGYTGSEGKLWEINDSDVPSETNVRLVFKLKGAKAIGDGGRSVLSYPAAGATWPTGWAGKRELGDAAARTKLAQKITIPNGGPYYIKSITGMYGKITGDVEGSVIRAYFCSSLNPEVIVGSKSNPMVITAGTRPSFVFPQRGSPSNISVDFTARETGGNIINTVDDIIADAYVGIIGGKLSDLDSSDLVDLHNEFSQTHSIYLDSEISFGEFLGKLETGLPFRTVSKLDGTYGFKILKTGEASVLSLFDEDFMTFSSRRLINGYVYGTVKVYYGRDVDAGGYKSVESKSETASILYRLEETLPLETYLDDESDAQDLAVSKVAQVETPAQLVDFKISGGRGMELLPGDVLDITRIRGDYTSGVFNATRFRILTITKNIADDSVSIVAQLDIQTY